MVECSLYNIVFCWYTTAEKRKLDFFQSLKPVDLYLKSRFLIKSGYYIVPSPSTVLMNTVPFKGQINRQMTIL